MDYTIIGMGVQSVYVPIDLVNTRMQCQGGFLAGELHNTYLEQTIITQVNSDYYYFLVCVFVYVCVCV